MNPEIKAKWVAALRSGEYKQGQGRLRVGDKYCCLGVLCHLYTAAEGRRWNNARLSYDDPEFGRNCFPSDAVMEWAGLTNRDPQIGACSTLADLNDEGESFATIADIIEREL